MKRGEAGQSKEGRVDNQQKNLDTIPYTVKDKITLLFNVIGRFDFYINTTNAKASLILAWNGIVIGALLLKYKDILDLYFATEWLRRIVSLLLSAVGLCSAISTIMAFDVIVPFLKSSSKTPNSSSAIFFGSVRLMGSEEYFDKVSESSSEEILIDLTNEGVILAQGLHGKMRQLKRSIVAIYAELSLIGLLFILEFVAQYNAG